MRPALIVAECQLDKNNKKEKYKKLLYFLKKIIKSWKPLAIKSNH